MITYNTVSKDTIQRVTTETIDLRSLRIELSDIEIKISNTEKLPLTITISDDSRLNLLDSLQQRKNEINNLLNIK